MLEVAALLAQTVETWPIPTPNKWKEDVWNAMWFTITDTGPNKITMISSNELIPCSTMGETEDDSNAEIIIKDGSYSVGKLQVDEFHLSSDKSAMGKILTQDKFEVDGSFQYEGAQWHLKNIKKVIDAIGDIAMAYVLLLTWVKAKE